jgi:MAF protein
MTSLEIVLASNSPRRRELLTWMGLPFATTAADIDETPNVGEFPADYVQRLAHEKARACQRQAGFGAVILAADTTVADGDEIIGKPRDREDALRILRQLRGRTHLVYTAIVVGVPSRGLTTEELCSTEVRMRRYSDEDLQAYVESGDPLDKAGAYAIQNPQFDPVQKISGCYASVMGLPLCHLERSLRRFGFGARKGIPYRCMRELAYTCPIFKRVLAGEDVG